MQQHFYVCIAWMAFCWGFAANFIWAQSSDAGLPDDPGVRIVERHYHHETYGTGFIVEIDLSTLPAWKGDLTLIPVASPYTERAEASQDYYQPRLRNPFGEFSRRLSNLRARQHAPRLPFTALWVQPLDSGVMKNTDGSLTVPVTSRLRNISLFIPDVMLEGASRVYFVFPEVQFTQPVNYLHTPFMEMDTLLPDLKVRLLQTTAGRYAGAAGHYVRVHYDFPSYLLMYNHHQDGMTPELTLNGKYPIPSLGEEPEKWDWVETAAGEISFFLPDALLDSSGTGTVQISFKAIPSPRIGYQQVVLGGSGPTQSVIIGKLLVHPRMFSPKEIYRGYRIQLAIGGVPVSEPFQPRAPSDGTKEHAFIPAAPVTIPLLEKDSLAVQLVYEEADYEQEVDNGVPSVKHRMFFHREQFARSSILRRIWVIPTWPKKLRWRIRLVSIPSSVH